MSILSQSVNLNTPQSHNSQPAHQKIRIGLGRRELAMKRITSVVQDLVHVSIQDRGSVVPHTRGMRGRILTPVVRNKQSGQAAKTMRCQAQKNLSRPHPVYIPLYHGASRL